MSFFQKQSCQVCQVLPLRSVPSPNSSAELMEVLPDIVSRRLLASY